MSTRPLKRLIQKGFTLIELIIVVIILGILTTIVATQFTGGVTDASRAQALYESAQKLASSWQILNQVCGTAPVITGNVLTAKGDSNAALNVLFLGTGLQTQYTGCYQTSGLRPLSDIAQNNSGTWMIQNAPVQLLDGTSLPTPANGKIAIEYTSVPDAQVLALVSKYGTLVNGQLGTSDTTNPNIQYGTGSGGMRSLYILRAL